MNSDVPFIITVKASNIYDNNDRYNLINNIKDKEIINYIYMYTNGEYYYYYYLSLGLIDRL